MMRIAAVFALVTLLVGFATAQRSAVVWRSYKSGSNAVSQTADERVIQNQAAFETYWREIEGNVNAPKDVDFRTELLVAVRLGRRSSGGYRVVIRSIERTLPNEIKVTYEERKPAPGALTAAVMTSPWEIVRVERKSSVGAFTFDHRVVTENAGIIDVGVLKWRTYICDLHSGGPSEFTRAIRNDREWDSYWRVFSRSGKAPSDIDWNSEMAVAIHLGNRPTDGYDVLIDSIEPTRGGFTVFYLEKAPSDGQRVRSNPSSPYVIVRLPRLEGDVQFRKRVWRSDGL